MACLGCDVAALLCRAARRARSLQTDLVVLNLATPLLRYEVLARGTRLYCRDEERVDRFEERVLREYLDTAHLRATQEALAR